MTEAPQSVSVAYADDEPDPIPSASRVMWEHARKGIEARPVRSTPLGTRKGIHPPGNDFILAAFVGALKIMGLYGRGYANVLDIRLSAIDLRFPDLPAAFDGYRILHLTDLHLDLVPELGDAIARMASECTADLCVMTGDYQDRRPDDLDAVALPLSKIIDSIDARDGIMATLGNHDDHRMGRALEGMGVRFLANETTHVHRNGERIQFTGVDDVSRYYTPDALRTLESPTQGFAIALVHSSEMAAVAAAAGYGLYLCGHTHGGQVCLPGGIPVVTRLTRDRQFAKGLWQCDGMTGYTSNGAGASSKPVRFFSRGEVTLLTLHRE